MVQFANLNEVWGKKEKNKKKESKKIPAGFNEKLKPDEIEEYIENSPPIEEPTAIASVREQMQVNVTDPTTISILKKYSHEYREKIIAKAINLIENKTLDHRDIFCIIVTCLIILDIMIRLIKFNSHR